jgi:hypothetical protein
MACEWLPYRLNMTVGHYGERALRVTVARHSLGNLIPKGDAGTAGNEKGCRRADTSGLIV